MNIPKHIAIIMDGNGRWAKRRSLPRIIGHKKGIDAVKDIVKACIKFKVKYLTLYAFSTENWMRPKKEVIALFGLLDNFLDNEIRILKEKDVRLCIIGDRDKIEQRLREKIEKAERDTEGNKTLILNVALSYGGREEILTAVRQIIADVKGSVIAPSMIDEDLFSCYLYTKHCPDPDLLIRTSGEMRVSNFLLWQISYAEIYVTKKFWPDFCEADLKIAIEDYQGRKRRFGR